MRLIEPEQITKMLSDLYISEDAVNMTGERQGLWVRFRTIEKAVSEIPTIDAVKVVRCKDCKHHEKFCFDDSKLLCWVHDIDIVVSPTDYCSYAERRAESEVKE